VWGEFGRTPRVNKTGGRDHWGSLESILLSGGGLKVGQVIGFFLHTNVVLSGSNATYTITQIRYGRVMDIRLTGPPSQRGFFVQPVSYAGGEVRVDPAGQLERLARVLELETMQQQGAFEEMFLSLG